jgi:hypothetical protein
MFLSRLSPVFETMITESENTDGSYYITISPLDPNLFQLILKYALFFPPSWINTLRLLSRYAYTEYVEFRSVKEALAVRSFCSKYIVVQLRHLCENYITRNIDSDSIWDVMDEPQIPQYLATKWGKVCVIYLRFHFFVTVTKMCRASLKNYQLDAFTQWINIQSFLDLCWQTYRPLALLPLSLLNENCILTAVLLFCILHLNSYQTTLLTRHKIWYTICNKTRNKHEPKYTQCFVTSVNKFTLNFPF